jgi:hypothetical protein
MMLEDGCELREGQSVTMAFQRMDMLRMGQQRTGRARDTLTREDREKRVSAMFTEVCLDFDLCFEVEVGKVIRDSNLK